jgi:hypothetical protein
MKDTYLGEELVLGDRKDRENPMQWNAVIPNLPGMENYDVTNGKKSI